MRALLSDVEAGDGARCRWQPQRDEDRPQRDRPAEQPLQQPDVRSLGLTVRLVDRLIAADKDFELLIVPGAEHTFIDCLAYVRTRCWDFLLRELMGTQPPAYRPAPIAIDPELLGEMFA